MESHLNLERQLILFILLTLGKCDFFFFQKLPTHSTSCSIKLTKKKNLLNEVDFSNFSKHGCLKLRLEPLNIAQLLVFLNCENW